MEEREDHFTAETKVRWPSNLSEQSPFHVFNNNNFFFARNLHLNMALGRSLAVFGINFSWTSWTTFSSNSPRTFSHILESGIFWADSAGQMAFNPPRNIPFSFLPA